MDKIYYQPNHLWKGQKAVKKLKECSKEKPKVIKQWLSQQEIQIWPKVIVYKVACNVPTQKSHLQHTVYSTCEMAKKSKVVLIKSFSISQATTLFLSGFRCVSKWMGMSRK